MNKKITISYKVRNYKLKINRKKLKIKLTIAQLYNQTGKIWEYFKYVNIYMFRIKINGQDHVDRVQTGHLISAPLLEGAPIPQATRHLSIQQNPYVQDEKKKNLTHGLKNLIYKFWGCQNQFRSCYSSTWILQNSRLYDC